MIILRHFSLNRLYQTKEAENTGRMLTAEGVARLRDIVGLTTTEFQEKIGTELTVKMISELYRRSSGEREDEIEEIIERCSFTPSSGKAVFFDFVSEVNWRSGDFGEKAAFDGGSCWWNAGDGAESGIARFSALPPERALAVRFFTLDPYGNFYRNPAKKVAMRGFSRAWLFSDPRWDRGQFVVANAYGYDTKKVSRILQAELKNRGVSCSLREIDFRISRKLAGSINSDRGILIYPDGAEPLDSFVNSDWFWTDFCPDCGREHLFNKPCYYCACRGKVYVNGGWADAQDTYFTRLRGRLSLRRKG